MSVDRAYAPRRVSHELWVPFASAEEAWFWAWPAWAAKMEGARVVAGLADVPRPCEPSDVVNAARRLLRQGAIHMNHVEALVVWGAAGQAPNYARARERIAWSRWRDAMDALEQVLRAKGIVA